MKRHAAALALLFFAPLLVPALVQARSASSKELIQKLESSDPSARSQAQSELRAYRFKDVVKLVADFGDGTNPDVRILMTQVLGELGGPDAARHLQKLYFKEKVDKVRRAILVQLTGLIPTEMDAFNFYTRVIDSDKNADLRSLAANQLALLGKFQDYNKEVSDVLKRVSRWDDDVTNRALADLLLASVNQDRFVGLNQIADSLNHRDPVIRRKAVSLIAEFDDPAYILQIQSLAESDPDPQVRLLAQKAVLTLKE